MNTTTITKSIKFTTTEKTHSVEAINFNIGHQEYAIIFEANPTNSHVVKEASKYVRKAINNAKNHAIIKIGNYNIAVQEEGNERIVYANNEVISRKKI